MAIIATGAAFGVLTRSPASCRHQPRAMLAARAYFEDLQHEVPSTFQLRFDGVPMPGYGWVFPDEPTRGQHRRRLPAAADARAPPNRRSSASSRRPIAKTPARRAPDGPAQGLSDPRRFSQRADLRRTHLAGRRSGRAGQSADRRRHRLRARIGQDRRRALVRRVRPQAIHHAWLADYDRLLRARFEKIFRFSEWIRDWYCKPPLLNLLVPLANRQPELRQLLANIVLGEREPRGYGPMTMLARLLVYLVRASRQRAPMTDLKQHFSARGSASTLLTSRFSRHPERYFEIFRVLRKYELHHIVAELGMSHHHDDDDDDLDELVATNGFHAEDACRRRRRPRRPARQRARRARAVLHQARPAAQHPARPAAARLHPRPRATAGHHPAGAGRTHRADRPVRAARARSTSCFSRSISSRWRQRRWPRCTARCCATAPRWRSKSSGPACGSASRSTWRCCARWPASPAATPRSARAMAWCRWCASWRLSLNQELDFRIEAENTRLHRPPDRRLPDAVHADRVSASTRRSAC